LLRWLVELVRATRQLDEVSVGASVRASLSLERVARAWALLHGRDFVDTTDVEYLFLPVVAHRLVFEPFALAVEGMSSAGSLLERVRDECLQLAPPPAPTWREDAGPAARSA
jgi:MoxR-like ATPase